MFFGRAWFSISVHQIQLTGELSEFVGQIMTINITLHVVSFMDRGGIMHNQNLQNQQSECGPILDLQGLFPPNLSVCASVTGII